MSTCNRIILTLHSIPTLLYSTLIYCTVLYFTLQLPIPISKRILRAKASHMKVNMVPAQKLRQKLPQKRQVPQVGLVGQKGEHLNLQMLKWLRVGWVCVDRKILSGVKKRIMMGKHKGMSWHDMTWHIYTDLIYSNLI